LNATLTFDLQKYDITKLWFLTRAYIIFLDFYHLESYTYPYLNLFILLISIDLIQSDKRERRDSN
jgi:hypothetical protein